MKYINNEKGAALIYVIMISLILTIFCTVIIMTTTNSQKTAVSSEREKMVTNLAVSGMQSLLQYHKTGQPPTVADQLTFLKNSKEGYYNGISIVQPQGDSIMYRQYLVLSAKTDIEALMLTNIVSQSAIDFNTAYKLVTTAVSGDTNNNQQRDAGEHSYIIKSLVRPIGVKAVSSLKAFTSYSFAQQTKQATIDPVNRTVIIEVAAGTNLSNLVADFTISLNATVKVGTTVQALNCSGQANRGCTTANNFSNSTTTSFKYTITASDGSTNDWTVVVTVVGGAGSSGIVWKVDANGNRTPAPFTSSMTTTGQLVITSSVGSDTAATTYDLRADQGIIIEPGVSLATTASANTVLSLYSSAGSVTVNGTSLKSSGTNTFSGVSIFAALDVDIRGATIESQQNMLFTAGRNIFAQNAIITQVQTSGMIAFTIQNPNTSKILHVDGLFVNHTATAGQSGVQICGALTAQSNNINGFKNFTGSYCN